jgi:hypothetical protein
MVESRSPSDYYNLINTGLNKRQGGHYTGEIIINSMDFGEIARFVKGGLWEEGAKYLNGKTLGLERAGADFIICASNTCHRVTNDFMKCLSLQRSLKQPIWKSSNRYVAGEREVKFWVIRKFPYLLSRLTSLTSLYLILLHFM